jgi:L-seryl-tRNA(Ser) seleniumtransferase
VEAICAAAGGYCNLEVDLASGARGKRADHVTNLLCTLTGAEAATVVNNNAAATLLILHTLARDAEVVVSRGQLVEIGGSYRLPDVMVASGARLREVGTTNRTRLSDYELALGPQTAAVMRVHTSNFRVVGFTASVELTALVELAHRHGKYMIDDLGSGALFDLATVGLPGEPDVVQSIQAGADVACFSGDKLLGGPQAGIIVGRREVIAQIESSPLMRTYRVDKLTLAALEATLTAHRDAAPDATGVPTLAMLAATAADLQPRAEKLRRMLASRLPDASFTLEADHSAVGGGALPAVALPTVTVAWRPEGMSAEEGVKRLRAHDPPVIARIRDDAIRFDLRTLTEEDFTAIVESVGVAAA